MTTKNFILKISFFPDGLSAWHLLSLTFPYIPSLFSFLFFSNTMATSATNLHSSIKHLFPDSICVPSYRQKEQKLLHVGSEIDKEGFVGSFNKSKVKRRTAHFLPDRHVYVRMQALL